jgi:hypothetical protein
LSIQKSWAELQRFPQWSVSTVADAGSIPAEAFSMQARSEDAF